MLLVLPVLLAPLCCCRALAAASESQPHKADCAEDGAVCAADAVESAMLAEDVREEGLALLQRRGAKRSQVFYAGGEGRLAKPSTLMAASFRKLSLACHNVYGTPERCSDGIVDGSMDVFQGLIALSPAQKVNYTEDERNAFKKRFTDKLITESKKVHGKRFAWAKYNSYAKLVRGTFEEMKPAVSEGLVDYVQANSEELGWTARHSPEMKDMSVSELKNRLGLEPSEEEKAELLQSLHLGLEDLMQMGTNASDHAESERFDGPFDLRTRWPQCSQVLRHVRFQDCNNCWSHSTALITESRVCIMLRGKFHGRDAWLSQSYVAACRPDGRDYCDGGAGTLGFKTVSMWGLPTGASDWRGNVEPGAATCFPQIPANLNGVTCPASCATNSHYPRDLHHDTFFAGYKNSRALHPNNPATHYAVKTELMQEGPVMMGFIAYKDLQAYAGGIYRPSKAPDNLSLGGHAVTVIGFGPGYYLCTNSWGPAWGDEGTFNIATEAINIGFYLPGKLSINKYGRFPVPIP